jgi:hypothetical protein
VDVVRDVSDLDDACHNSNIPASGCNLHPLDRRATLIRRRVAVPTRYDVSQVGDGTQR